MAKTRTYYDLLISCPSDVKEELKIINEQVDNFNRMFGRINNISIDTKHWSKDSYPQSGGKPQELLNQQFVLDCDAAVAVFWTRFGTPTDEYGSGTEEEIEKLIQSGKQVFLYFCEKEAKLSDVDWDQYKKIQEFKERYKDKGIFWPYSTLEELEKLFLNHLTLYFLDKHVKGGEKSSEPKSVLSIKGVSDDELIDNPRPYKAEHFLNNEFIQSFHTRIVNIIDDVKQYSFIKKPEDTQATKTWAKISIPAIESNEIYISDYEQKTICNFAKDNEIEIDKSSFFDLAGLKEERSNIMLHPAKLVGSNNAIEKLDKIKRLFKEIREYNQWISYNEELNSKYYLRLCLSNDGNRYDEDIDVKLFIKEGLLCTPEEIPVPGQHIIERCINDVLPVFKGKPSLSINAYEEYPPETFIPVIPYYTVEERTEQMREKFRNSLSNIFVYELYKKGGYDIIRFKQPYLKHKNNVLFPSILIFNSQPDSIQYEIQSKYAADIVRGEIQIKS
ncbi:hypothetical protein [Bacillus subtilis]|uniref:hypothetical protein n=1 Tax=Bacillus subtilis TaxID=1423 RepID=UPI0019674FA1|nr:hypothetical protein [Bacillus subtilis]